MERYLINYLKEAAEDDLHKKYIDYFKMELDEYIYNYGEHISSAYRRKQRRSIISYAHDKIQIIIALYMKPYQQSNLKNILSCMWWFPIDMALDADFNLISSMFSPWGKKNIIGDKNLLKLLEYKRCAIRKGVFKDLYDTDFFEKLESQKDKIITQYKKYDFQALFLPTDAHFECKYLIDIFNELKKPSLIFSHGLPGFYSLDIDNRGDYLMVWGEKIKQNYINTGFDPNKIFVSGNPKYSEFDKTKELRNSLENILIIPCSSSMWTQLDWGTPLLIDRSMVILYLYKVQSVLKKIGVKHARFRPHPSIDKNWVHGFLDHDFYEKDEDSLSESCSKATLVIGATSTVFLEALMYGVNYIIFEPKEKNETLARWNLVPPFDGSEQDLEIANTEEELEYLVRNKYQVNVNILHDYMNPLDISVVKNIIS
ncbi:MAG: hypothetical protein LBR10_08310 [Prevotellaceae bacterium]|jgi:hypothetical protein|nr:hypothetical protein [Prevotellaceae bacterium]